MDFPTLPSRDNREFRTTRWSEVAAAGGASSPDAQVALERLCLDYWPPLFAFALRRGNDRLTSQDLTQAFFARFIERGYLRAADRNRGRFRTFLMTCFQHFLVHEWEKTRREKRGGSHFRISWDDCCAEVEARACGSIHTPQERHYDREWALLVFDRAMVRLRDEYARNGNLRRFERLVGYLQTDPAAGEYLQVGLELSLSARAVRVIVHRLRRRFGQLVSEEVRGTVASEADAADELRYLVDVLSA